MGDWVVKKREGNKVSSAGFLSVAERSTAARGRYGARELKLFAHLVEEPLERFQRVDLDLNVQPRPCFGEEVLRDSTKTSESSLIRAFEDDPFLDLEGKTEKLNQRRGKWEQGKEGREGGREGGEGRSARASVRKRSRERRF